MNNQIIDDFLVYTEKGLFCTYGDFYIDPQKPVTNALISHAHADHATKGNINVYCTNATQLFMIHRYKKNASYQFYVLDYYQKIKFKEVEISLLPAGHILGSAMILMEYKGVKYLYTGDYKLQTDLTCEPIELVTADVLISESTFAKPDIAHPSAEDEIKKLNTVASNIMLGSYALGKSQRLIHLINQYCPDKKILVHHTIHPLCKIYEQLGVDLGKYQVYDRKLMKNAPGNYIYIVPPLTYHHYQNAINVLRVFASGWSYLQEKNSINLFISDHVDWNNILHTVKLVKPKQIWTLHGDGKYLQEYYKDKLQVKILN